MKKKNIVLLIVGIVTIIALAILNPFKKEIWDINAQKLINSFDNIDENLYIEDISEYIPFEWDELYSFSPYTPKEEIYEIIGYEWDNIKETVSESMNQLVFIKDDKVVCYLYGYPENMKLGFNFGMYKGNYIKLTSEQKQSFELQPQKNDFKFLRYIK